MNDLLHDVLDINMLVVVGLGSKYVNQKITEILTNEREGQSKRAFKSSTSRQSMCNWDPGSVGMKWRCVGDGSGNGENRMYV